MIGRSAIVLLLLTVPALGQVVDPAARTGPPYYDAAGVVPLRDFMLRLLDEKDRRDQQRFEAQEQAVKVGLDNSKTAIASDLALKIQEQGQKYIEKAAAQNQFDALDEKVNVLTTRLQDLQITSAATANVWALIVGAVGLLIGLGGLVIVFMPTRKTKA